MSNDKRFTFKFLGVLMEIVNVTPNEVRKTFWHVIGGLGVLIMLYQLPAFLALLCK